MNLSQHEWAMQLQADAHAIILDVRTEDEFLEGCIPTALNFDIYKGQTFLDDLQTLNKEKNYYVYCKAGSRSEQACAIMHQLGFENTFNLQQGFSAWQGAISTPEL